MKKFIVFMAFNCLFTSVSAFSQNRARVFDNFDTNNVTIAAPAAPKPVAKAAEKNLVKKTAQVQPANKTVANLKTPTLYNLPKTKLMMSMGTSLDEFTTGDAIIDSYIVDSSRRYGIDPLLIYAQMHQESSFKKKATSYKGASGLMQLMPATARRFGVTSIYDPKQNIDAGVKYMRWLMDTFGNDVNLALAGYNAGEGAVMKYGNQIPPYNETREYVRRITARYTSIRNPSKVKSVKVPTVQLAKLESKESAPLTVYERNALTVRLPDGRMRLVNQ
jgi:soluble lytic murein transglycosylase-like protein